MALTPMMQQYYKLKKEYPGCVLLFRMGDFYEGFEEDAKTLSKILGITLTARGKGENRKEMAGIPYHALKNYLPKLVRADVKVAIAEQMEEAQQGRIVEREVVKVITAGTLMDENVLDTSKNNYIASLFKQKQRGGIIWGLSYADVSTGEFRMAEYALRGLDESMPHELITEIFRIRPAELIIPRSMAEEIRATFGSISIQFIEDREYSFNESERVLMQELNVTSLKGFGVEQMTAAITSAGELYKYLLDTQKTKLEHINKLSILNNSKYMLLDQSTIRNLELITPIQSDSGAKTLYDVLNNCATPMGQRLLRHWILRPLLDEDAINNRLNSIQELHSESEVLDKINSHLNGITDLERVVGRVATKAANARDMLFLRDGLTKSIATLRELNRESFSAIKKYLPDLGLLEDIGSEVITRIDNTIRDDAALTITEGNIIKKGYNADLDEIKDAEQNGKSFIQNLQAEEIERTGISSLKVRFNKVFGYYIEVRKSNTDKVPDNYVRKQTLVNAERYITDELKVWEEKVLGAEEKAAELEYQIFEELRVHLVRYIQNIQQVINLLANVDVLVNFANISKNNNYVKPIITSEVTSTTDVVAGRHPVVESFSNNEFIPNDLSFNPDNQQLIILTGPNMSGKSTYIRQSALIVLMAQIGCYVPADSAKILITDRIFTRVGASDNLAAGESTFMVEMNETANILNNATAKSLLILDEVGRGTSTYDGVAIAWAIVEYLAKKTKARTLFATHYHELMQLEEKFSTVKNFNVDVREDKGKILFMRKIVKGGTDQSYGIHVADIAGLPKQVITRANNILEKLEEEQIDMKSSKVSSDQLFFMQAEPRRDKLREELDDLDINLITPIDALKKLEELKQKAQSD